MLIKKNSTTLTDFNVVQWENTQYTYIGVFVGNTEINEILLPTLSRLNSRKKLQ